MKYIGATLFGLSFFLLTLPDASGQGWRGIVPLHSTRADVERSLGSATESGGLSSVYKLERETVIFHYAGGLPCESAAGWRVPRGTVVYIAVVPTTELQFSELHLDKKRFRKESGYHRREDVIYIDEEEGLSVTTTGWGMVTQISYSPSAKDNRLRCPKRGRGKD